MELATVVVVTVCPIVVVLILIVAVALLVIIWRKRKSRKKCARLRGVTINMGDASDRNDVCKEVHVKRITRSIDANGAGEPSEILKIDEKNDGPEIRGGLAPDAINGVPPVPIPPMA